MNFIRSKKQTPSVYERLKASYEEVYAAAVDCITLESNDRHEEALRGWQAIAYSINDCMEFLRDSNGSGSHFVRTNDEYQLLNRIQEVSKRCNTEIAQLTVLVQKQNMNNPFFQQQTGNDYFGTVNDTYAYDYSSPPVPPPHGSMSFSQPQPQPQPVVPVVAVTPSTEKRGMLKTLRLGKSSKSGDSTSSSSASTASRAATLAWPDGRSSPVLDAPSASASSRASSLGTNNPFEKLTMRGSSQGFNKIHETRKSLDSKLVNRKPVGSNCSSPSPSLHSQSSQNTAPQSTASTPSLAPPPMIKKNSYGNSPPKLKPPLPSPKPSSLRTAQTNNTKPKPPNSSANSTSPKSRSLSTPNTQSDILTAATLATQKTPAAQKFASLPSPKKVPPATAKPQAKPQAKPANSKPTTPKPAASKPAASKPAVSKPAVKHVAKPIIVDDDNSKSAERSSSDSSEKSLSDWDKKVKDIIKNLRGVDESAAKQVMNEIVLKGDEVHWDDIAGLEQAKASLKEAVVYPFLRPDLFSGLREPARGMLLFGPPGTGKTMLARAVATESHSTFFSISASSLTSKFLGESEKLVRALFELSKALAPSIIFVDEIDSLLSQRADSGEHEASRRIKNEFLIQWSALQSAAAGRESTEDVSRVLVLAATNLPWAIDEAARRRFVRRQYIPLPEQETRLQHLRKLMSNQTHALADADYQEILDKTEGFSGSDMTALAKDAAMGPLRSLGEALLTTPRDQIRRIGVEDFISSLNTIRPSVSLDGLKAYEDWAKLYGSSGA